MNSTKQGEMLQQANTLMQSNQIGQARQLLEVLANQNNPQALYELGCLLLIQTENNLAEDVDASLQQNINRQFYENPNEQVVKQAIGYLHRAEALGYAAASYRLAYTSLTETAEALDWHKLAGRLQYCCEQNHANALCDAAIYFARYDSAAQAQQSTAMLERAALKGSIIALALLGMRLAHGRFCQQDQSRANSIFALCHELGLPTPLPNPDYGFSPAEPDSAVEISCSFDFSQLIQSTQLPEPVHLSPLSGLLCFHNALSEEECFYVQCAAEGKLEPSIVVDEKGNSQLSTERTSHDFYFLPEHEQVYLNLLQRRMAAAARLPLANSEQLTMLKYEPGQEFRLHRDNLPPNHFTAKDKGGSGQRQRTVIAYLAKPERGGETEFPLLSLRIPAEQGQILCFDNLLSDGKLCRTSLHAGLPVIQGVKWICTLWMREAAHRSL